MLPAKHIATAVVAAYVVVSVSSCSTPREVELVADSMVGNPAKVQVDLGPPTVWVSSHSGSDPRPGGKPDPKLCTIDGGGSARLVEPESGNTRLGETDLYAVAKIEDLEPPATVTCSGSDVKHFYIGVD